MVKMQALLCWNDLHFVNKVAILTENYYQLQEGLIEKGYHFARINAFYCSGFNCLWR